MDEPRRIFELCEQVGTEAQARFALGLSFAFARDQMRELRDRGPRELWQLVRQHLRKLAEEFLTEE
jgi:hypothetical protein